MDLGNTYITFIKIWNVTTYVDEFGWMKTPEDDTQDSSSYKE